MIRKVKIKFIKIKGIIKLPKGNNKLIILRHDNKILKKNWL